MFYRETAADENSTSYFPLLDRIADGYFKQTTDRELYDSFLRLLQDDGHITDPNALSSFELALSLRTAAPRIEAHYQFYNTSVEPSLPREGVECETWIEFGGKQYCTPVLSEEKGEVKNHIDHVLPFDRILGDSANPISSILYTDITSPEFSKFHKTVISTAKGGVTSYRIRHKPPKSFNGQSVTVNGYGVELALKRTDYIVIDDRQDENAVTEAVKPPEATLGDEEIADLKPLSQSELLELGVKAASFVLNNPDPMDTLLKLSQDFPKHSHAVSAHNISADFLAEHRANRALIVPAGYNVLWVNGLQISPREIDAFSLLERLRRERKLVGGVQGLGLSGRQAINVLSHKAITEVQSSDDPQRYDFRDEIEGGNVILWMNNIEKDKRYQDWPETLNALLQRTFPGQLPSIRKDIHNAVMPVDFTNMRDISIVVETLQNFVRRKVPIRFGLVPITDSTEATEQARLIYHLLDTYGLGAVMDYLEQSISNKPRTSPHREHFESAIGRAKLRKDATARSFQEVLKLEELEARIASAKKYLNRLGADTKNGPFFMNGIAIPRDDDWMQNMSDRLRIDLQTIQRGVFEELFEEDTWLPQYFLFQASTRRNPLVIPENEKTIKVIDMAHIHAEHTQAFDGLPSVTINSDEKDKWAHLLVIADFDSKHGLDLLTAAKEFRKEHDGVQLILLHSGTPAQEEATSARLFSIGRHAYVESLDDLTKPADGSSLTAAFKHWTLSKPLVKALGFEPGQAGLILNGRAVGPIPPTQGFSKDDFDTLLSYEIKRRIQPAITAAKDSGLDDKITDPFTAAKLSSLIALSMVSDVPEGIFESTPTTRTDIFKMWNSTYTAIEVGDYDTAVIQLVASVDPSSEAAQRWLPILKVLSELNGVHLTLYLNPRERLEELPVKRFYRYIMESKPKFAEDGSLKGLAARFKGLPAEALLTMGMDVPPSWLVAPQVSVHDLDNIKISSLKTDSNIDAVYELEHILIEGHSRDSGAQGSPPRGAQVVLSTEKNPHVADTIIMANLGYLQFKANPGFFRIELEKGRSRDIFSLDSAGTQGYNPVPGDENTEIALMSFQGVTLYPRLSRKPGMEDEDVLDIPETVVDNLAAKGAKLADTLLAKVGLKEVNTGKYVSQAQSFLSRFKSRTGITDLIPASSSQADINIFSVASGHLYERMLNIMMLSVMKHTNHTVKFWFIEQFLSPSFKEFLPTMAAEYNFQYEMVTYKWPHWLRAQKEKQREIWGYKILFLDVLFPLNLDKVIFVDADQIVRTDMYELVQHDLQGAPYGFTPMCDSRTEMEGFRFWKQGYWKNFLRGLPYHISALYVVDLVRFRQIAAGDRLRQQYHQLSADPASLSNLDQDLPNNMQMQLPIHSLPQEWLWCETWCSDESLGAAKTIDLCNNPMTKEPKLDRARRQVPEWTRYDEEIAALARRVRGVKSEVVTKGERGLHELPRRDEL
ncbi:glycosyltransferase family 24 protein [Patellaria atrata CBS 101060]|uniref:Glycosyltransferase family 24 protein n=1 Tax=Patellaria atrata CBS 101060 TaxID=1346257 RepID=A0A9P4S470_9PEZI|nr:glycosyltransferase family 24 protein [Patellaria atrata CBS 101060]